MSNGPRVRTDVVEVFIVRRSAAGLSLLLLRRVGEPMGGTWQPVFGHVEQGESALAAVWRELEEETGLTRGEPGLLGAWQLERVHPYFLASIDAIVLSPRFVVEVAADWTPRLNGEHDAVRWVDDGEIEAALMWPSQRAALAEIREHLPSADGAALRALSIL